MSQTDKFIIAKYIDDNKDNIVQKYEEGLSIAHIAKLYDVAYSTIYFRLVKWGVKIRKPGGVRRRRGRPPRQKRKFSPEFLAHQAELERLCGDKVKYIKFEGITEDQKLVRNILSHPIIG